jgi:hypothetical protein
MAQPIPQALSQLVTLNVEYRKHKVLKDVWKQVEQYFDEFPFEGVINGTLKSTGVHKLV